MRRFHLFFDGPLLLLLLALASAFYLAKLAEFERQTRLAHLEKEIETLQKTNQILQYERARLMSPEHLSALIPPSLRITDLSQIKFFDVISNIPNRGDP